MRSKSKTLLLGALLLVSCILTANGQHLYNSKLLDTVFESFRTKNYSLLRPLLAPDATIGNLLKGPNDVLIPQILAQLPLPGSYMVISTDTEGTMVRIKTEFKYVNGTTRRHTFLLNREGKIRDLDILQHAKDPIVTSTSASGQPERFNVPFKIHQNNIFMKAKLNGNEAYFILDNTVSGLILNSKSKDLRAILKEKKNTKTACVKSFELQGLLLENLTVRCISFAHPEKRGALTCAGVIGYSLFENYTLLFDYERELVTFVLLDEQGEQACNAGNRSSPPLARIPFDRINGIPVISISANEKEYKMGVTFGGVNPIGKKSVSQSTTHSSTLKTASVGKAKYKNLMFTYDKASIAPTFSKLKIDGMLGSKFLMQHVTSINLKKQEMCIYAE